MRAIQITEYVKVPPTPPLPFLSQPHPPSNPPSPFPTPANQPPTNPPPPIPRAQKRSDQPPSPPPPPPPQPTSSPSKPPQPTSSTSSKSAANTNTNPGYPGYPAPSSLAQSSPPQRLHPASNRATASSARTRALTLHTSAAPRVLSDPYRPGGHSRMRPG